MIEINKIKELRDIKSIRIFLLEHDFDAQLVGALTEGQLLYIGMSVRVYCDEENTGRLQNFLNYVKTQGKEIFDLSSVKIPHLLLDTYTADAFMSSISYWVGLRNSDGKTAAFNVEEVLNILQDMYKKFRTIDCSFLPAEWSVDAVSVLKKGLFAKSYVENFLIPLYKQDENYMTFCSDFSDESDLMAMQWSIAFLTMCGVSEPFNFAMVLHKLIESTDEPESANFPWDDVREICEVALRKSPENKSVEAGGPRLFRGVSPPADAGHLSVALANLLHPEFDRVRSQTYQVSRGCKGTPATVPASHCLSPKRLYGQNRENVLIMP